MKQTYLQRLQEKQFKDISNLHWYETFVYWITDTTTGQAKALSEYLKEGLRHVKTSDEVYKIAVSCRRRTPYDAVYAIEKYVYNRWKYLSDKKQFGKVDYWESIEEMLQNDYADCESMNRMIYVLCRLAGIGSSFLWCCIGDTSIDADYISDHFYTLFFDARRSRYVALDTAFHPHITSIKRKKKWICGLNQNYSPPEYTFNEDEIWKFK